MEHLLYTLLLLVPTPHTRGWRHFGFISESETCIYDVLQRTINSKLTPSTEYRGAHTFTFFVNFPIGIISVATSTI